jgi:hypothetical protein
LFKENLTQGRNSWRCEQKGKAEEKFLLLQLLLTGKRAASAPSYYCLSQRAVSCSRPV